MESLKVRRDENLRKLAELGHQLRHFAREQQLGAQIAQLELREKALIVRFFVVDNNDIFR